MLNEMKYVYAVYQEKSFSKAAKKLFISQPALSNMVRKAEREVGAAIFDRSTIPLTITKEGAHYIKSVEEILFIQRNLKSYFEDLRAEDRLALPRWIFLFLLFCISGFDRPLPGQVSECDD